jgi:hypothetical protein
MVLHDVADAQWLTWKKTRDEVFGLDAEAWCESWAYHLIFGAVAEERQVFLDVLSDGETFPIWARCSANTCHMEDAVACQTP